MKILFVSEHPDKDAYAFSKIPENMRVGFQRTDNEVDCITAPLPDIGDILAGGPELNFALEKSSAIVEARIQQTQPELVICQGSACIPHLDTSAPLVLWHDSAWGTLLGMSEIEMDAAYPHLADWDAKVSQKCKIFFLTSQNLCRHYERKLGVARSQIRLLPFGSNLPKLDEHDFIASLREKRDQPTFQLTFNGFDYARKGLLYAAHLNMILFNKGIDSHLNVIGVEESALSPQSIDPVSQFHQSDLKNAQILSCKNMDLLGKLPSVSRDEPYSVQSVILSSHFLIHPAAVEPFGIAVAESAAYGVPALTTSTDGPATIVRNGLNGYTFPLDEFTVQASNIISNMYNDRTAYEKLAISTYEYSREKFCWIALCKSLIMASRTDLHLRR